MRVPKNLFEEWRVILAALYLADAPHRQQLDHRRSLAVQGTLRALGLDGENVATGLRSKGLISEAVALESCGTLDWAHRLPSDQFLTSLDSHYPDRWLAILKDSAPPVLWSGGVATDDLPVIGVVGSRSVEPFVHAFCAESAQVAVQLGFRVVSGAAVGCDRAALGGASDARGQAVAILPYGARYVLPRDLDRWQCVGVCKWDEVFSRTRAMERNALIYAAGRLTIVGDVRFRKGGTWHGASAAIRRKLTQVLVRRPGPNESDESIRGARALVALGAHYLDEPGQIEDFCRVPMMDHGLFAGLRVG